MGPAHDFLHVLRVVRNAEHIGSREGADCQIVVPAALLHELFNYPKGHQLSHLSGEVAAEQAEALLLEEGWPLQLVNPIRECIRVHPYSRGILPATLEGKVLQDADRLDAIGAIGIARCFATSAEMSLPFYNIEDPFCSAREPDDRRWGIDHFYCKLLRIPEGLHTVTARSLATSRVELMTRFLTQFGQELTGDASQDTNPL
jgi:uncharacterized protein